jgi:hypothetical protein
MTNTYRAADEYGAAHFGDDVFEADFDVLEERDHLDSGHLEIVPRQYKVLSDNFAGGTKGEPLEAAYPMEVEAALLTGGHLMRVDDARPAAKKAAAK